MAVKVHDTFYFVRQPIFSPQLKVKAYQLIFRANHLDLSEDEGSLDEDNLRAFLELVAEMDWEKVANQAPLFIELPPRLVQDAVLEKIPLLSSGVIVATDWRAIHKPYWQDIEQLVTIYHFLLGVTQYDFSSPLPFDESKIRYVRADLPAGGPNTITSMFPGVRDRAHWIAGNVKTHEQFVFCRYHGFKFFTGPFYLKPKLKEEKPLQPSQVRVLQVLRKLEDPKLNLNELTYLLQQDVSMSEQVVRMANRFLHEGEGYLYSILDAVRRLGMERLKLWVQTYLMTDLSDDLPELARTALIRAQFCACMGEIVQGDRDMFYTAGLFSLLDVILDRPLHEIVRELKLQKALQLALLEHAGHAGAALHIIESLEKGEVNFALPPGVSPVQVRTCYTEALHYADEIMRASEL
ncbi:c-di-GMP-related signal transduction protein, contains EAL and HDOD domains [Sulfurivirga caldicuralii]|uniref:C-di-GMP-related signal transduction protein, contains EAL and HDOD domains n=1 Tax=Sulfurivirga caldicuralii TaxID=364032 RepID=A0A1N6DGN5_9GAMM|nr:HDOD domain-containing protein [Sulfurivirga caldicuralii]SIN69940.1 c-di-GMP-related signal transduction protein, contains EAL and HDOD domains [Sulfurivirga caldicuralii]